MRRPVRALVEGFEINHTVAEDHRRLVRAALSVDGKEIDLGHV
jgi:hypothetical protein